MVNEQHKQAILSVLEAWHDVSPGYWFGYAEMLAQLQIVHRLELTTGEARKALKVLKAEGKVKTEPIFSQWNGKLNGTGWFFVPE